MGYARALLQKDVRAEAADLQKKAKMKSLWGSIGRTVGQLGVMAITGGTINPVTLGFLTGAASYAGGAIGAKAADRIGGKLTGGKFFKSDRAALQRELGAFGTQNLMSSLKSGITAGIGQKLKLAKSGETAAKGLDFEGSFVGKGKELSTMRGWQGEYESLEAAKKSKELTTMRGWQGQYEAEQLSKIKADPFTKGQSYKKPDFQAADSFAEVTHPVHGGSTQTALRDYGGRPFWDQVDPIGGQLEEATMSNRGKWDRLFRK